MEHRNTKENVEMNIQDRKKAIAAFADRYLKLYLDPSTTDEQAEATFGQECFALGFVMDSGESFFNRYPDMVFSHKSRDYKKELRKVDDIDLLASGIFSYWRWITHWLEASITHEPSRGIMIASLSRLKELCTGREQLRMGGRMADAVFFHLPDEPYGFLSNWYPSPFEIDGIRYSSCEQYIMYQKCILFGDENSAGEVLATDDPETQQTLGRAASGWNEYLWNGNCQLILRRGLIAKFTQNDELRRMLLDTGDAVLVEAANSDKTWACGRGMHNGDRFDISKWDGTNILGFALMDVRDELRAK